MDSLIANALSSGDASNIHIMHGTVSGSMVASWDVNGYQDSTCVLVSVYVMDGFTLTCIALKNNQVYQTRIGNPLDVNNSRYYGMGVAFKTTGTISINMGYGNITGYVSEYMIIGIP